MRAQRTKLALSALAVVGIGLIFALLVPAHRARDHDFFDGDRPLVIAHRGGRGLWPENTLYAFSRAVELGVDVLEMDLRESADGALVIIHDSEVDRATNGQGRVNELTLAQIKALDAGYRWTRDDGATYPHRGQGIQVPTLEEVLQSFPNTRLNIEVKSSSTSVAIELCEVLRSHSRQDRVLVASFHDPIVKTFRNRCPEYATAASSEEARSLFLLNTVHLGKWHRPAAEAYEVPGQILTPRFVAEAHRHNVKVLVWTVNHVQEMKRLLAAGVDGILTDYPDRLLSLMGD